MNNYHYKKSLPIPFYRGRLQIIISNTASKSLMPIERGVDLYAHALHIDDESLDTYQVTLNFDSPFRKITHGVIAHEAVHIAHMLMESRGIDEDLINDEPMTYLVEWIVDQIYQFIDQKKFKVNIKGE